MGLERTASLLWLLVTGGQSPHGGKATEGRLANHGLHSPADEKVGCPAADDLGCLANGLGSGCTGSRDCRIVASGLESPTDVMSRHVGHASSHDKGADSREPFVPQCAQT